MDDRKHLILGYIFKKIQGGFFTRILSQLCVEIIGVPIRKFAINFEHICYGACIRMEIKFYVIQSRLENIIPSLFSPFAIKCNIFPYFCYLFVIFSWT